MHRSFIGIAVAAVVMASSAQAVVVADSLPYATTPDWSDVIFSGTSMILSGGETELATANSRGVFFGWREGSNPPAWTIASNNFGNYLSLTTKFSSGADDWVANLNDGIRRATMVFNKTDCNPVLNNCYTENGTPGVTLYFAGPGGTGTTTQFISLDTTQYFTYEMLLIGDNVTYRINGKPYVGTAGEQLGSKQLVIGDESGSSRSGTGQMWVSDVSFDRAPAFSSLPSLVPEPGSWAMLIAGFGLTGAAMRRRNKATRAVFCLNPGARHGQASQRTRSSAG